MSSYGSRWQMDWTISRLHEFPPVFEISCPIFCQHPLVSFSQKITFDLKQKSLLTCLHKWELSKIKERSKENSIQQKTKPTLPKVVILVQVSLCIKMKKTNPGWSCQFLKYIFVGNKHLQLVRQNKQAENSQPKENPTPRIYSQGKQLPRQNSCKPCLGEAFKLWQHALKMVQQYAQARRNVSHGENERMSPENQWLEDVFPREMETCYSGV